MEARVFEQLCCIARETAGISLNRGKEALVTARVAKRLRILGLGSEREYLKHLEQDRSGEELVRFLDVITTNHTSFLRERDHFDYLTEVSDKWTKDSGKTFRIWCAAAATGEEPYTIAMTLLESFGDRKADFRILATDISTRALGRAVTGVYEEGAIAPIPRDLVAKYFERSGPRQKEKATYSVRPSLRKRIVFQRLNLAVPPFPMRGPLDVVFCRNVMIYFDRETRQGLISEIERLLSPGGILFTGHSETLAGIRSGLKVVRPSVYLKPNKEYPAWSSEP